MHKFYRYHKNPKLFDLVFRSTIVESHGNEHKSATAGGYVLNGNLFLSNLTSKPNWTKSDYDIVSLISEWKNV